MFIYTKRFVVLHKVCTRALVRNFSKSAVHRQWPKPTGVSYLSVPGRTPLMCKTIGQVVDDIAEAHGDAEALIDLHQNIRRTFAQLRKESDDLAEALLALGLQKGDRVGIWGPNSHQWYITHHAVAKAGLVLVNINPAYQARELKYGLARVGVKCLIMDDKFKTQNYYEILNKVAPEVAQSDPGKTKSNDLPHLKAVVSMSKTPLKGAYLFDELMDRGRVLNKEPDTKLDWLKAQNLAQFDDIVNIQFTSGTTGNPKGVMLSHHNLVNNSFFLSRRFEFTPKDKVCVPVPFFHCYGQVGAMLASLHSGVPIVLPSPHYDPQRSMEAIETEKCTILYGTPTMHVDMIHKSKGLDLSSLRLAVTAGAICPDDLVRDMAKVYGAKVCSCYGLTETSPVFYQSLPDDDYETRVTTVGYPQEHCEVKIVDLNGNIVPLGVTGEMCVRGYMTMLGYWDEPTKTAEVLKPDTRWFHTGDTFVMQDTGHARIVGRIKEMIIRGGENIYPREIEDFLQTHPAIAEAYVFGVADERMGEEVAVAIRVKDGQQLTEQDIRSYCKGQISHFKIPRYILFRGPNDIPKTISGKVQKFRLRELAMKELNLKEVARSKS